MLKTNTFGARAKLGEHSIYRLDRLARSGVAKNLDRLPFSIRILLEALLRNENGYLVTADDVTRLAAWNAAAPGEHELPFMPARVILQDFTGVPCVVDLAAMRDAVKRLGGDAKKINPRVPVDLVIDHSVLVDYAGTAQAVGQNAELEFARNRERYEFLKWGAHAFQNLRVVPPATGIVHQVNLEYLAQGVLARGGELFPDTLVGADSHTTMINGLGVLGWGVGGIEAEAVMLGQPYYFVTPQVVGFKLTGALREGVTATDLVLTVTQMLRQKGVVEKFIEFYGAGLSALPVADRATIGNMAPDYGATTGFFPTDDETLRYLRATGRTKSADLLERYAKEQMLFRTDQMPDPIFSDTLALNLADVEPSVAGPKRPGDRIAIKELKTKFRQTLTAPIKQFGYGLSESEVDRKAVVAPSGDSKSAIGNLKSEITHGAVVLAAITSCTNTSNPSVMIGAGLLAKKAVEAGLNVKPYVKTSLAPGSKVVTEYLDKAGLTPYLEKLGFYLTGYGCTVCIGNSGPLAAPVANAIREGNLVVAAVLSGNRNFEGRVHPLTRANFLASPPLVVAYALAGTTEIDLTSEPLGIGKTGAPVFLRDLWPSQKEIAETMARTIVPAMFTKSYGNVFNGNPMWNAIQLSGGAAYDWNPASTYIAQPPFFADLKLAPEPLREIRGARVLGIYGDSTTTDHISPAGGIALDSPAGRYLMGRGVAPKDFNQYGTRRGNHEVLMRGTFANIRIKNLLLDGVEGSFTLHLPDGAQMPVYDAAMIYKSEKVPLIVFAGKEYGTGSSRDWAAKGPALLGVRAVIAQSFERTHRANLVGMGVLPLAFKAGQSVEALGLTGRETYDVLGISGDIQPRQELKVVATSDPSTSSGQAGHRTEFSVIARLDTPVEVDYYKNGGILPTVLRGLLKQKPQRKKLTAKSAKGAKKKSGKKPAKKPVKKVKRVARTRRARR
ncbi:MAG: aconitate hydratase AcnA [Chloroflexi bacterium]|nr:aconitate hydratase AcnA [Chloroflexota bacterium]